MPVHDFVGQNAEGRELAPDTSHETLAVIEIIKRVYEAFNHHQHLYALIANLNKQGAMADLVVITERGFGIVELNKDRKDILLDFSRRFSFTDAIVTIIMAVLSILLTRCSRF